MSDCNHQCSSCSTSSGCQEKEQNERVINNTKGVRSVIGVVGGKGGVGKSLVTSLLAIQTQRLGYRAAGWTPISPARPSRRSSAFTSMRRPRTTTCCRS